MEINIKANLDDNGQIQSVTSTCAQSPGGLAPLSSPMQLDRVQIQESKVISYAIKKDLCNKLDANIAEMSQLILELKRTKETLDIMRKLNREYSEKIERHKETIEQLQETNNALSKLLYKHNIPVPETYRSHNIHSSSMVRNVNQTATHKSETLAESIGEQEMVFRSSTTELKFGPRLSSISMTDSLYSKPSRTRDAVEEEDQIKLNRGDSKGNETRHNPQFSRILSYSQTSRPKTLNIPKALISSCFDKSVSNSGTISDNDPKCSHDNVQSVLTVNDGIVEERSCLDGVNCGYKAPKGAMTPESVDTVDGPPNAVGNGEEQTDDASRSNVKSNPCPLTDENGYLVLMVPTHSAILQGKITQWKPDSGKSKPEMEFVTNDPCFCCQCHGDNDVHVTWIDFHKCRNSCSSSCLSRSPDYKDTQRHDTSCGSPFSPKSQVHVGHERREQKQPENVMEPCLVRSNAIHPKNTSVGYVEISGDDDVFDVKEFWQKESDPNIDDRYSTRPPPPIPRMSNRHSSSTTSPCSEYGPERNGAASPERSKIEDKPNNVMKMMRRTLEWDSAKRLLLEKSHTRTSQDAESTLGVVVKETLESFQVAMEGNQRRGSKNLSDRLIRNVKESLVNKRDDDVITTEFLEKCIQLCERVFL